MNDKRPSEVFLALWYARICGQVIAREEFFTLADTWTEIRRMEEIDTSSDRYAATFPSQGKADTQGEDTAESTPPDVQKVHPESVEKVHVYAPESTPETDTSSAGLCPAPSPQGEGLKNTPSEGNAPARDESAIGKKAYAARLANLRQSVADVRSRGVSMQSLADAGEKLTLNDVLDFLEVKAIPLPKISALEKAVKKLEAEG